ncbi:hypothetical protein DFP72DRAFT_848265 [Ephemerocybe angulata]|uniref:Uncharacterized protein n=1 Tax=Ephemerocybe angulata TaxID=980116 RepID=A0A8H6M7U8_9AGAR|nr:hypothetical protein DFP72DRAFT_848265 [Tulosesus angulatus]
MKSFAAQLVAVSLAVSGALAQTVNTPANAVVCQPLQITWSGGTPPYFLSILPGNQPSAAAIRDFGTVTGTSFTWNPVNLPAGTLIGINLRDSTGTLAQSAAFPVNPGTDDKCLTATTTSSTSTTSTTSGSTSSTTSTTSTTTSSTTTTTTATTTTTTPRPSSSSTSTTSTSTTGTAPAANTAAAGNGAAGLGQVHLAGALGAIGAAALLLA